MDLRFTFSRLTHKFSEHDSMQARNTSKYNYKYNITQGDWICGAILDDKGYSGLVQIPGINYMDSRSLGASNVDINCGQSSSGLLLSRVLVRV